MILRVDIRGNGDQLSNYLLALGENSQVEMLEIDGRERPDIDYLFETIKSMELNAELTKTNKAFFHTQLNPRYGEDKAMTRADWYKAADILAAETGYTDQRRVIVLHTKKGRTHAHVVWERYDHATGKMIDNQHSKLKANAARPKIEQALGHKLTPARNPKRPELKQAATAIWKRTATGADFMRECRKAGYMVASGTGNRPFMIVDENGRSFDLVRQLEGVRTKEVRARLRNEPMVTDKQAIEIMREQAGKSGKTDQQKQEHKPAAEKAVRGFAENKVDALENNDHIDDMQKFAQEYNRFRQAFDQFKEESRATTEKSEPVKTDQERKQEAAQQFAENRTAAVNQPTPDEIELEKIRARQEAIRIKKLTRKRHR